MCVWKSMAERDGGAIDDGGPPPAPSSTCIDCLLQRTDTRYWRKGLLHILRSRHNQDTLHADLHFIVSNITNSIRAQERGVQHSMIAINYDLKPDDLNLVNWRRILVGMRIVLEEPDTNFEIRNIGVCVGARTDLLSLHGLLIVLKALLALPWDIAHMVLNIDNTDSCVLFETLTDTSMNFSIPSFYLGHLRPLYHNNMAAMRLIGFYRRSPEEEVTWTRPERQDYTQSVLHVLRGLLRGPSGVQATS